MGGRVGRALLVLVGWGGLALAIPARAQAAEVPLAEALAGPAKEDYRLGVILYQDQDFQGARVKFASAHARSGDPRLLWNIAACEKSLRRYGPMLRALERYQRETSGRLTEQQRAETEALMKAVRPLVTTVHLLVDQPGAKVHVDDELVGTTPLPEPLLVELGARRLRVTKVGFKDQVIARDFTGGSETTFNLTLAAAPREGQLTVDAGGTGTIALDGKVVGEGRWTGRVPSGRHTARVSAPGLRTETTEVVIQDGESRVVQLTLVPERPRGIPAMVWIGGGVLLAAGAGTAAFFLSRPASGTAGPTLGTLSPGIVQLLTLD